MNDIPYSRGGQMVDTILKKYETTENREQANIFHSRPQALEAAARMNREQADIATSPWRAMHAKFGYAVSALTPDGILFIKRIPQ